jgi:SpoVK/Ycf46/Vps4 family AAA+-type ATPase
MNVADAIVRNRTMPDPEFAGYWESVIVPNEVKHPLITHALLALTIRQKLPFTVTALHGMIALVGPPGTGKTTLALGLAYKLSTVVPGGTRLIDVKPHGLMSAEHGQSQQAVDELLVEHLPSLAADEKPTIVVLDEVESMAVARSAASLSANPVDVHRATDAVLTAMDALATAAPHIVFVVTSNYPAGLDEAFLSRADRVIDVPRPRVEALAQILRSALSAAGVAYPGLKKLSEDPAIARVAAHIDGADGRQARKLITAALAQRQETALDPNRLTITALQEAAADLAGRLKPEAARVRAA